ncbi:MerR family transcriptional regulator [Cellulophaga baltica]|uniref:MerR family transcriptional regulator n=1 Tax=Cellulophaga TaxID=104264 RepID=UPI001C07ADC1|nr:MULTISPECIES: MerR family transcriptional regulator [Cellulophaga]MBU2998023.1 MerR family transcriptional regulator [Cellulophaga baltica]MDO6769424.1 MerR family transcriptional regulator [Cellulophaga sp. 1_MG-2023]
MNKIKSSFSIRDLENISGIKAHTIRIWEKRYHLLEPQRTDTNIRNYSLDSLQKLLNITLLYNNGYKISNIAQIEEDDLPKTVKKLVDKSAIHNDAINSFKMAMINFDTNLFYKTYNGLLQKNDFTEIFHDIFIPLFNQIGLLWQTKVIRPSHEHFITNLIRQKIILNTEKVQSKNKLNSDFIFVLFLPEHEIHELALLYLNYELQAKGHKTIYLGHSVPLESLKEVSIYYPNIHFISYFTTEPNRSIIRNYIEDFKTELEIGEKNKFWVLGYQSQFIDKNLFDENFKKFNSIKMVTSQINSLQKP